VLSESESRLKTIINAMPAGIYLVEVESQTIVDANYAATNMSGYSYEELVGSHCCGKLCPRKEGECPLIKSGGSVRNNENIFTRKDGTEFSVMKTAVRIRMNGKDYFLETFIDISEQKRLEQLKEDVDRIVQHDLRSPISSIINATTLSLLDESVQGEHREVLEIIKQKGYKVLNMMGLSLAMYKMEAGTFKYVPEQLELMRIIQRVLKELEILTRDKNITVQIRLNGKAMGNRSSLYVKGDKLLMESMLSNLLKNCIEATDYDQQFSLDIDKDKDLTMIFSNPGVVPENIRDTFFDKYATAGKKSGTGLGTYSANLIATTVGGSITMKTSDEENKTTITVRLPVG